jgi:hypothetical protein
MEEVLKKVERRDWLKEKGCSGAKSCTALYTQIW